MGVWLITMLVLVIVALLIKIHLLRKGARELAAQFNDKLQNDTNTLITLSTCDRDMRALASTLNDELRTLRRQRLRYENGDRELKQAVTSISHDLRTPLTAISGTLDLLDGEPLSDNVARSLAVIRNRTDAMTQLTEELFRYSVILAENTRTLAPIVLNDVLAESLASFYGALTARGITPTVTLCEARVVRSLDKASLARIFSNILNNALKYSDGDLHVCLTPDGSITFANHAASLDSIAVGRLFDRFFTVENARHSTGLGLSIARTLAEQMGGTITASFNDDILTICVAFA